MKITFTICVLLPVLVHKSVQQCFSANDQVAPNRKTHADLYAGQQDFSLALLNAINKLMPEDNLFFSPYSTYHALLIAYFMSGKQTESYLKKVLRLKSNEKEDKLDIFNAYKLDKFLTQLMAKDAPFEFTNANKIYVANDVPIRDCIQTLFHEEIESTAFKPNPEAARQRINQWVENATHNMIKDLLPAGTIDQSTNLVLVNAAYFKGIWENKFDPSLTKKEVFYVSPTKQIMVDMMHVEGSFGHDVSEKLGAHILELPYQGNNISMFILLPPFTKENSIEATLKNLTLENFMSVVNSDTLISKTVQVALPKFSLETTIELVPILEKLGVGNLFRDDADFSSLTQKKISVAEGVHKARIDINEIGSQAAAATTIFSWRLGDEEEVLQFTCNKPFIYFIYNKKAHTVLFTGQCFILPHDTPEKKVLEKMGVGDLFEASADFTTLTEEGKVNLGRALHKAKIEVNEHGTKAAAATVLFSFRSSRPLEPAQFICNHPFVYVIYDKDRKSILFNGVFRRPY